MSVRESSTKNVNQPRGTIASVKTIYFANLCTCEHTDHHHTIRTLSMTIIVIKRVCWGGIA